MEKRMERLRTLPPVKAVRALRWRRRVYRGMLPKAAAACGEASPAARKALLRMWGGIQSDAELPGISPATAEDMRWCRLAYGFSGAEYRCYGFAEKPPEERRTYVSDRESVRLSYLLNDLDAMRLFSDKWETYRLFGKDYGREAVRVASAEDREKAVGFLARHPVCVLKPLRGACGRGVRLVCAEGDVSLPGLVSSLFADGPFLLEERILQSGALAAFHHGSVNTVRIVTFGGRALPWPFLKAGRGGALTDNGASGGIMAGIDPRSGRVVTAGIDEKGMVYQAHPDTGVPFAGAALPEWESLTALCEALAAVVPRVRLIGWDMAHTDGGWIVVEGNAQPEAIGPQAAFGRGLRAPVEALLRGKG